MSHTAPPIQLPGTRPRSDASPESLVSRLRRIAAEKREAEKLIVDLPGRWAGVLRAHYGMLNLDELERYQNAGAANMMNVSLDMLAHACKAIEVYDPEKGKVGDDEAWDVLKDERGPVTFDDRLTRLLDWPRPSPEFEFSARQVYETMIGRAESDDDMNGVLILNHASQVNRWMGLAEQDVSLGESQGPRWTSSGLPLYSE